ncbi:efflux transporter outer membrane subunit [Acidocella facilis]|uniref:efflux transporter outer membrane subunit n=1 Tax=Acidocella facilis TaxID=525 RepID=UPI001F19EF09|nr:efflux transporter outer membrane subunit [Acidocella facilis]
MKPAGFRSGVSSAALALALLPALAGCAVGPNYHPPAAPNVALTPQPLPAATSRADGAAQAFRPGADIPGDWWHLFRSPALDALIAQALANNPSLKAAQETLVQAQETVRAAQGSLIPSISSSLGAQRDQGSSAGLAAFGGGSGAKLRPYTLYNASLSVSYSVDVFGGERRQIENYIATAEYQRWELEASYLTLTSNIVTAAVNEASLNGQIQATRQVIGDEQKLLTILQTQARLGGVPQAQVLQQQSTLAQQQASLPPLQSQLAQAQNQLAAYAGQFPGNFHLQSFTLDDLTLPADLPVSLPSAIVAQRPDIQAAAAQLHEASANVGVADANMLPQITLSAQIGHESLTPGTLFTPQTLLWNLVSGLTQPIFEGGQLAAQRKGALAALRGAGAQYQSTVISAFQNVADALTALQYDAATLAAAQTARDSAAQSLQVTQAQYKLGGQPFTAVLNAEVTYQTADIAAVKAKATRLADTAALYQALGGGWWHRQDVTSQCCGVIP